MKLLKLVTVSLCLFAIQISIIAQETTAGKKFSEQFWEAIAEGKEFAAKTKLESLKRREPNFDVAKMEQAYTEMITKKASNVEAKKNELKAKVQGGQNISKLFDRVIQADSSDTQESVAAQISEYNDLTKNILSMDRSTIQRDLDSTLPRIQATLAVNERDIDKLIKRLNESIDAKTAEYNYFELLLRQSYWDNARKIFPDQVAFTNVYNDISNKIKNQGTFEERNAKATKNLNAKIDTERMLKAAVKDANLEKIVQTVFTNRVQAQKLDYSVLKVVITNQDYGLVRHNITGIILGRYRWSDVAFKDKDGKCKHITFQIYQDYIGGSFSGSWRGDVNGFSAEMRCENVNK